MTQQTNEKLRFAKDALAKAVYGISLSEAIDKEICVDCRKPALPKCYSDAGRKEFYISGLCEECFDKLFAEDENEAPEDYYDSQDQTF